MDLKVIEPIKNYIKEFKTVDEFNLWYSKNKEEVDALTTHKLNKMYKILGYRITKIKGVLMLKKLVGKEEKEEQSNEELKKETDEIRNIVNKIISFLQQGYCYTQDSSLNHAFNTTFTPNELILTICIE